MIPYGRQHVDEDDIAAVVSVLRSDWLTQGPAVAEFERRLCTVTGATHAVAFANGTAALHAAMFAARVGPGDLVCTSPLSFAASANCGRYVGAEVQFVDIDPATLNLDPAAVPQACTALVAVHYAGLPADLRRLPHRPRVVIEDAAHAIGASTPDGPVGNCAHSDVCCFSFHAVKTITTGEGGAATTNSDELAERLRRFRHHGIRPAEGLETWAYDIPELGHNYRLTDLQAALGTSQLGKLERFIARRTELAEAYDDALGGLEGVTVAPRAPTGFRHGYHLYPLRLRRRDAVAHGLRGQGIATQVHYVPTYRFGAYEGRAQPDQFPETERAYARLLSIPLFPDLGDEDQRRVIKLVEELA
jgi:perosamine synthetase